MDRKSLIITISILLGVELRNTSGLLRHPHTTGQADFWVRCLMFLPGYLLLRIFNTKTESISEEIFLEVALSISVVMIMGIFANFVYPLLGGLKNL
ncbi:hypothetical protein [Thermococcus peptonophilus]|uniref:hypothetical protein n=1 Tax=Thermococcus peptonophilus TaxID=53952 RepID=UPI0006D05255